MRLFLDSSALAKRYVEEPGSERLEEILGAASRLGLCVLVVPEVVSALRRRRRERTLTEAQYGKAKNMLLEDVRDAEMVGVIDEVVAGAVILLERFNLRAFDALHVAAAQAWSAELFVSADERQLQAAAASGLVVERLG
ncbi:MAG TPA: type II toxin-antitoxin system VapC family toxin [Myxococcota bacterium]|nr:type II toxin-antitoxin system VapC family toxin [Myxococcota bacterium]